MISDSDSLMEPLRRLEIAAEWFRVAYRMKNDPRENAHLYRQLAEMKKQLEALEAEFRRVTCEADNFDR